MMKDRFHNHADNLKKTADISCTIVRSTGDTETCEDEIIREQQLEVSVNGYPAFILTCTPDNLTELTLGRLYTERIIRSIDEVKDIFICGEGNIAEVKLREECIFQPCTGPEPTCCTGNRQLIRKAEPEAVKVLPGITVEPVDVFSLVAHFREDGALHKSTGGTHSCYIRFGDGRILSFEDIGRHNALDKAVGAMLLYGEEPENCILFTTGRVAEDMAEKAVASGIPVLISKAVPTEAAVELAKKYNLTLICKAWPDSYRIY